MKESDLIQDGYSQNTFTIGESKKDFLIVLEENYQALFSEEANEILSEEVLLILKETYEDLIKIYKYNHDSKRS